MRNTARPQRRIVIASVAAAGAALALALLLTSRGSDRRPTCKNTLIPAYLSPPQIVAAVKGSIRARVIVVNPHNGPGAEEDAQYHRAVRAAQGAGARVLGYVPTNYGARPAAAVAADVDRYATWYGVDGIFLDEASSDGAHLPYYQDAARHSRASGAPLVAVNPGVVPARGYFDLADIVVTFEGPYAKYAEALRRMPKWVREQRPRRTAHLVYGASREQALDAVRQADGAGYLYVTSGSPPDPWSALPPYLADEERELEACS